MICPFIAFVLTRYTELQAHLFADKPTGFYILSAGINLIACWICYKKGFDKVGNGLILATFLGMLILVFTKNISTDF